MALIHYIGVKMLYLLRNLKHCSLALYKRLQPINQTNQKFIIARTYRGTLWWYQQQLKLESLEAGPKGQWQPEPWGSLRGCMGMMGTHGSPASLPSWLPGFNPSLVTLAVCPRQPAPPLCDKVYCLPSDQICLRSRLVHEEICPPFPSVPCLTTSVSHGRVDPSPADLPHPGIEPGSPALQVDSLPAKLSGKPVVERALGFKMGGDLVSGPWLLPVKSMNLLGPRVFT